MDRIQFIKDERILLARALKSSKGRQEHRKLLLLGEEILNWALAQRISVDYVLVSENMTHKMEEKPTLQDIPCFVVSDGILKKVTDTHYLVPVVGVAKQPVINGDERPPFVVVLDSLQDYGNIGTIIRTCHGFGIQHIISTNKDFDLYQRKTIEASRGSAFGTKVQTFSGDKEVISYLKENGYQIVATSPRGSQLQSLLELKKQPVALVVGNETAGISPEFEQQADFLIQIPMYPTIESLNVGVATGISIYELKLKQVLAMIEERIKSTLGRELNVAGMLVQQALDAALRKVSSLSSKQVIFMMVLKCDQTMQKAEMCKQFGVLENEAEAFLAPLITDNLVIQDKVLQLTSKGEELLAKLWPTIENTEHEILSDFTAEEAQHFMQHLHSLQQKCVDIINDRH